jgi:hypothetical protein
MCGLPGHTYNECLVFFGKPGVTFISIGDLECSGACLLETRKVGGQDTQEDLLCWLLLLLTTYFNNKITRAPKIMKIFV